MQQLMMVTLVVKDYDEAISYYTGNLGFDLIEDTGMGGGKRWVVVAPKGSTSRLLLAKAKNAREQEAIGNQTGGRVFLFLHTDDLLRDYHQWLERGVEFVETPREEAYGLVVVFRDLYGNKWDLIQPR